VAALGPIFLFTDFGSADLYVGQVKAVLHAEAPRIALIDLLHDAPPFDVASGAHLLAALAARLPAGAVVVAVVDPGVGGARAPVVVSADGRYFVGPDNGLLSVVAARAGSGRWYAIDWMPQPESVSFHGRDLFAPAAARIACGTIELDHRASRSPEVDLGAGDLARVIFVDHYGNAITGLRAPSINPGATLRVKDRAVRHSRVFSAVPAGELFWYENSIGLVEIAAGSASAASLLGIAVGEPIEFQ
jgi:S-adenosylmethionine hydrolase